MTVLSIDTGDLSIIEEMAQAGLISDATTNPLFVSQAGLSGDPRYSALVAAAVDYAHERAQGVDAVHLAMDRLAVNLGIEISKLVKGQFFACIYRGLEIFSVEKREKVTLVSSSPVSHLSMLFSFFFFFSLII